MRSSSRWCALNVAVAVFLSGCAQQQGVTITTRPPDAMIKIDGVDRGRAPVTETFQFTGETPMHRVTASRMGFTDQTVQVTRDFNRKDLVIELKPRTRKLYFQVLPVPAIVSIDGKSISNEPLSVASAELEFTVDSHNNWTTHKVTAERKGLQPAQLIVSWTDPNQNYTLTLEPLRKDVTINTEPTGADIYVNGQLIGTSPVKDPDRALDANIDTGEIQPLEVRAEKAGYDPAEVQIGWDDGKTDYTIDLPVKHKMVRIVTNPEGGDVKLEGQAGQKQGRTTIFNDLPFPPVNEKGELRTYKGTATKKTADSEWYPAQFTIAWDNAKTDYVIPLKEITTRPVSLLVATMQRGDEGWEIVPKATNTVATKDVTEGAKGGSPIQILRLEKDQSIGSIAISPDGLRIVYTILTGTTPRDFRSVLRIVRTDGSGTAGSITDGRTLDLFPAFTPGGDQIIFSSNRASRRMQVWSMSATGTGGVTRLTSFESNDIWPSLDSDPKPRLFYQAMIDNRADPRIYMTQVNTVFQTDLTQPGGQQPRVSPKNDSVLFAVTDESSGKRDIYRVSDRGGAPENLTNTPDADEFDATWTRDGRKIAFTSDRGVDADGQHNYDIWVLDLGKPSDPIQVTTNGSVDDSPMWGPDGRTIYFRSNRGGAWGIWKTTVK
jgi:Tol biopolymer transport system component